MHSTKESGSQVSSIPLAKQELNQKQQEDVCKPELEAQIAAQRYMVPYLQRLEALLPNQLASSHYFFLAINEVAILSDLLPLFCHLWRESNPHYTWLMFINTDSNVALLAGCKVTEALARLNKVNGLIVIDPFTALPFDITFKIKGLSWLSDLLDSCLTFGNLLDMLRYFGRPLWSTGLYLGVEGDQRWPEVTNILAKLLIHKCQANFWPEGKALHQLATLTAVAAQQLPLRFIGVHSAHHFSPMKESATDNSTTADFAATTDAKTSLNEAAPPVDQGAGTESESQLGQNDMPAMLNAMFAKQSHFLQQQVLHHL